MTAVDWSRLRKCPVCAAKIGQACASMLRARTKGGTTELIRVLQDHPHPGRKLRTGGTR